MLRSFLIEFQTFLAVNSSQNGTFFTNKTLESFKRAFFPDKMSFTNSVLRSLTSGPKKINIKFKVVTIKFSFGDKEFSHDIYVWNLLHKSWRCKIDCTLRIVSISVKIYVLLFKFLLRLLLMLSLLLILLLLLINMSSYWNSLRRSIRWLL